MRQIKTLALESFTSNCKNVSLFWCFFAHSGVPAPRPANIKTLEKKSIRKINNCDQIQVSDSKKDVRNETRDLWLKIAGTLCA